jgi:hypothetical protein
VLQVRERATIPSPSIVFIFGLVVESIKEFGGASRMAHLLAMTKPLGGVCPTVVGEQCIESQAMFCAFNFVMPL